jgi:hypothetical protein
MNPRLFAQSRAQLSGTFELYRTPIAPPKSACGTCATQAVDWLVPRLIAEHYRYYKVWIYETSAGRIVDKFSWFSLKIAMLKMFYANAVNAASAASAASRD